VQLANSDMLRARVIWIKLRLRQEFPMNRTEASVTPTIMGIVVKELTPPKMYSDASAKIGAGSAGESAAYLLLALKRDRGAGTLNEDELANMAIDTDGDGFKELVDGWGNPMRFYRWPTGATATDLPVPAGTTFADPFDTSGTLNNPTWAASFGPQFAALCHPVPTAGGPYLIAVVASSGRDSKWGLDPKTMAVTTAGDAADNIYSYNLK
jgi:hypothetical protein